MSTYEGRRNESTRNLGSCISLHTAAALALDGQDALKGGGGDAQPLGHGNVVLHGLGDGMPAHHQHPGAAEQVAANVDAALVLLGNRVIEEKGQKQRRADRGKAPYALTLQKAKKLLSGMFSFFNKSYLHQFQNVKAHRLYIR